MHGKLFKNKLKNRETERVPNEERKKTYTIWSRSTARIDVARSVSMLVCVLKEMKEHKRQRRINFFCILLSVCSSSSTLLVVVFLLLVCHIGVPICPGANRSCSATIFPVGVCLHSTCFSSVRKYKKNTTTTTAWSTWRYFRCRWASLDSD